MSSLPCRAVMMLACLAVVTLAGCRHESAPKQQSFEERSSHPELENAQSIPGKALAKAETITCQSNLQQIRQMIRMDQDQGGTPPQSIEQGATAAISRCPISGKVYSYDAQTGKVWCTTSGHEKF